jgi:Flp pilus assembly protein TadG
MTRGRAPLRGNAALEFSFVFLLFWALIGGCVRIGYSTYIYYSLVSAVAGAARYAARADFDVPNHNFVANVANMAVYGSPSGGGNPLAPGLTTASISVTWTSDATGAPLTMTVSIKEFSVNALFQTLSWRGKPSVTVRYAGTYKP